jgi:predicted ATPase
VAAQVGLQRSGGESNVDALTRWLADRDLLLVLDNCEHVVSAVAQLVEELIARLPRLHVLATSREPLWVMDELNHRLAPLTVAGTDAGPPRSTRARRFACSGSERATECTRRSTPIARSG